MLKEPIITFLCFKRVVFFHLISAKLFFGFITFVEQILIRHCATKTMLISFMVFRIGINPSRSKKLLLVSETAATGAPGSPPHKARAQTWRSRWLAVSGRQSCAECCAPPQNELFIKGSKIAE